MTIRSFLVFFFIAFGSFEVAASDLPQAIQCYQKSTNSEDAESYMSCFASEPTIIDVGRTITGRSSVKKWALGEVLPHRKTFRHRKIIERRKGYAKTEVKWMNWVVHYHYWWNQKGKIEKMSLQYAD